MSPDGRVSRRVAPAGLRSQAADLLGEGYRLALAACHDDGGSLRAVYVFAGGPPSRLVELHVPIEADHPHLPSLAGISFPAGRFEREMHDLFGVVPDDHPLPRRLVRHPNWPAGWYPMRHDAGPPPPFDTTQEPYHFLHIDGPGVYEIPVGPVHAGLIEPGHFRFSVVGETILKLKIRLWFVHRGIEKLFEGRQPADGVALAERISGDTAIGHNLAYTQAAEDALGITVTPGDARLRAMLLELERVYNHITDLGALANDVGYSVLNGHAQHLREQLLRLNRSVTGHRLLRGAIGPGTTHVRQLPDRRELTRLGADMAELAELVLANSTVRDRFARTARLTAAQAGDLGCLGYVARASGVTVDARHDHPTCDLRPEPVVHQTGDVLARFLVRRDEIAASLTLIDEIIESGPGPGPGPAAGSPGAVTAGRLDGARAAPEHRSGSGVGIVEGWRGTIVHRVEITDGAITRHKIVDPSWFNWPALPVALGDTIVPDFPLTNKSFNLSYAGNDL
ncbi:NADH-quinone oxidoreductase subunit C [Acidiferrimicrobium sp. IK]|uniref:hydrogenase large subunit n=1 Tax=Acidiferrimicrobium sp. IK TaxID=2871700 RepID=UPI0021CB0004|nr:NADH-quinone oxidoreductase subunit C [Acidiferrimicrobium sp. IK]MCU4186777.1 NADH-quinone oxidoreductase subunit C [Acidiferrimicrobium sp. IK]